MLQYTPATNETEREGFLFSNPPLRCAWASFYMLKGSPTGGNVDKGKNGKRGVVGTATRTVHPT